MLGSERFKHVKDQGEILFSSTFLKNLSKVERYEFLQLCHCQTFQKGEYIYYRGDPGGMYLIETLAANAWNQIPMLVDKFSDILEPGCMSDPQIKAFYQSSSSS